MSSKLYVDTCVVGSAKCDCSEPLTAESSSVKWDGEADRSLPQFGRYRSVKLVVLTPSIDLQNNGCSGVETVHYPQRLSIHKLTHPQSLNKAKKTGHPRVARISSLSPLCPLFYFFFIRSAFQTNLCLPSLPASRSSHKLSLGFSPHTQLGKISRNQPLVCWFFNLAFPLSLHTQTMSDYAIQV